MSKPVNDQAIGIRVMIARLERMNPDGTSHPVIPAQAVEAAARAIDASKAEGCGCCAYPEFTAEEDKRADELGINVRALQIAKEALEAAAPYIRAQALDDAKDALNPGGSYVLQNIAKWLSERAATERTTL